MVTLTSQVFNGTYYYETSFFCSIEENGTCREPTSSDFVTMNDMTGRDFFESEIRRVKEEVPPIQTRDDLIQTHPGEQAAMNKPLNVSGDPRYIEIENKPIFYPIKNDIFENEMCKTMLGYNLFKEKYQALLAMCQQEGEIQTMLTLYGAKKNPRYEGLFNLSNIQEVNFEQNVPNDISYLFDDVSVGEEKLQHTSIRSILESDNNFQAFIKFTAKMKDICARNMHNFTRVDDYLSFSATHSMLKGVFIVPRSDYLKMQTPWITPFLHGTTETPLQYFETVTGLKVLSMQQFEADSHYKYQTWDITNSGENNIYLVYDKNRVFRDITSNIAIRYPAVTTNYGLWKNCALIGSATGTYSFENTVGLKFIVPVR